MIIDDITIELVAGNGGDGSSVFVNKDRQRKVAAGGDGGRGGSIFFKITPHLYDLSKYQFRKKFKAENGKPGLVNNKSGKAANDVIIDLPPGTMIKDESGTLIVDLNQLNASFLAAEGGSGGKGNYKREYATGGEPGQARTVRLDYRIPNDVALVGFPNTGKTSLFNALTSKDYKVAAYPYTTASCVWAPVEHNFKIFTLMDMPALGPESHNGRGMGNSFLKHLYRTKLIIFLIDSMENRNQISILKDQIERFDKDIVANKKFFYLLMKTDTIPIKDSGGLMTFSVNQPKTVAGLKDVIIKALYE